MPTVSVIIPTWNRARELPVAIDSALSQTLAPLEVLVCDDGSTDATREVIRDLCDPRVRWVEGERSGLPAVPRNRGIRESRGEWIAFLDSDDQWLPGKLARQLARAGGLGCRAACSNALRVLPGEGDRGRLLPSAPERLGFSDLVDANKVVCSSAVVQRSLFERAVGFPEEEDLRVGEDYALWLRVATITDFAFVDEPLVRYWDDPRGSARSRGLSHWTQRFVVFGDFLRWAKEHGSAGQYVSLAKRRRREARVRRIKEGLRAVLRSARRGGGT